MKTSLLFKNLYKNLGVVVFFCFIFGVSTASAALNLFDGTNTTVLIPTGQSTSASNITLTANSILSQDDATSYTLSGIISGAFSLTYNTTYKLTLSGVNTYSGGSIINPGAIVDIKAAGNTGTGSVTMSGGTLWLDFNAAFARDMIFSTGTNSSLILGRSDAIGSTISFSGTLTGSGGVSFSSVYNSSTTQSLPSVVKFFRKWNYRDRWFY